jgi:hypothetical protein
LSFFCLADALALACFCAACLFLVFGDLSPIGLDSRRTGENREGMKRNDQLRFLLGAKRTSRPTR